MALGDIVHYDEGAFGYPGDVEFAVASGTAQSIKAGEPVARALGATAVAIMGTGKPLVGTDFVVGIAATTSTDTATADGVVKVTKLVTGDSYLISPKTASSWNTQTKYNDLVGKRVTLDLTSSTWTINATDSGTAAANNGCIVLPLDIKKYPGKVRFAFRVQTYHLY